jgi:hypothetical protein
MAIINISELKLVLGIGTIYSDEVVQQVADAASDIILSYLDFNRSSVVGVELTSNVATFYTAEPHDFVVGQEVTTVNCPANFNVTEAITVRNSSSFDVAIVESRRNKNPSTPLWTGYLNFTSCPF